MEPDPSEAPGEGTTSDLDSYFRVALFFLFLFTAYAALRSSVAQDDTMVQAVFLIIAAESLLIAVVGFRRLLGMFGLGGK